MALEKDIIEAHSEAFVGKDIMAEALQQMIKGNWGDAIGAAKKLYQKQYQTLREIKDLEQKLSKAQESLKKTTDKIAKVESGDLSALFEADKQEN